MVHAEFDLTIQQCDEDVSQSQSDTFGNKVSCIEIFQYVILLNPEFSFFQLLSCYSFTGDN